MEGDSLNIINMLNDKIPSTWTIEDSIMEIKALMANFEKVIFSTPTIKVIPLPIGLPVGLCKGIVH